MTAPSSPPVPAVPPRWILHPPLLAAAWVLDIALANHVEPAGFGRSLAVAIGFAVVLTLIAWAAARERMLGGLIATAILLASVSLRPLDALWEWVSGSFGIDAARGVLGGLLFAALAVPAFLIVRATRGGALLRAPVTSVLNRLAAPGQQVTALREATTGGPVWRALRAAGYRIVVNLAGYEHVSLRTVGDEVLDHGEMNDLERIVLGRTWLLDVVKTFVPGIYVEPWHDRIPRGLDDLEKLAVAADSRSTPTFAWVHIPAPHFAPGGECRRPHPAPRCSTVRTLFGCRIRAQRDPAA